MKNNQLDNFSDVGEAASQTAIQIHLLGYEHCLEPQWLIDRFD